MADRFPSIEDIDAGESDVRPDSSTAQGSFLERERALLGEDADLFAAGDKTNAATVADGDDDDLLGGDGGDFTSGAPNTSSGQGDLDDFESSFPAIDTRNDNIGPGGTITNSALPYHGSSAPGTSGYTNYNPPVEEDDTEPIREWRSKRDAEITRRDEASQRKKDETIATSQEDIDSFYESYNRKVDKQKAQTAKEAEEFLKNREDTTAGGTSWERIAKLVDLSGKGQSGGGDGSSKKKFRELLVSLKSDKNAPGVAGL
ncbi:hypothetical protein PV10_07611 [Exophiala mesophila]|uniref:Clathrin light chain n=1 Tax=Exophiala mesophila TaxID=212818 RepID=A0A0D1Z616_EXOME|nr:uncharacterized protein PV10_07611 [Exophiala mesophila]KIV90292.1 hypothetical protein PV10_07611 [Exophiala mesophila]